MTVTSETLRVPVVRNDRIGETRMSSPIIRVTEHTSETLVATSAGTGE